MNSVVVHARTVAPGLACALVIGAAAAFLSEHYTAPIMLYALLLGMAFNFLTDDPRLAAGLDFTARHVLRLGVALLGLKIGWSQIAALGWTPVATIAALIAITIGISTKMARLMGFNPLFGFLSGGATAICGASAAMALSAALPAHEKREQATLFTVIGVSVLSTAAMIVYPSITHFLDLNDRAAGVFIGATIHDVAQVVGAGYAISREAGDTATIVKLMRVAMLLPVVMVAGLVTRRQEAEVANRPPLLPGFVIAFLAFVLLNSAFVLPVALVEIGNDASRACLVAAIASVGMKTRIGTMVQLGWRPTLLMIGEAALLALLVLGAMAIGLL